MKLTSRTMFVIGASWAIAAHAAGQSRPAEGSAGSLARDQDCAHVSFDLERNRKLHANLAQLINLQDARVRTLENRPPKEKMTISGAIGEETVANRCSADKAKNDRYKTLISDQQQLLALLNQRVKDLEAQQQASAAKEVSSDGR